MLMVRPLLAIFIWSALLGGCTIAEDVKQIRKDLDELKSRSAIAYSAMLAQLPRCNPPGEKSGRSCYYKLQITRDLGNGRFLGRVPESVVAMVNQSCRDNSREPDRCPTSGDTQVHEF